MTNSDVTNQTPSMAGANAYLGDPLLMQAAARFPKGAHQELEGLGAYILSAEAQDMARLANNNQPVLHDYSPQGQRIDQVEYHPAYHALMRRSVAGGLHSSIWESNKQESGARYQIRAARFMLTAQLDCGHLSSVSLTSASLGSLMATPDIYKKWAPLILTRKYDHSHRPINRKTGLTIGLAIAEKQAGTDMSMLETIATPVGNGVCQLQGHKWSVSAPMSDAFIMLTRETEGVSCFLVPRLLPSGKGNGLHLTRLKEPLGWRSQACAEMEITQAMAYRIGQPGEGSKILSDMMTLNRTDMGIMSAGLMRAGLAHAVHHSRHRIVSGTSLIDKPIMQRVLSDMALDAAAATALVMRLAQAFDQAAKDRNEAAFARVMTPVAKYWTTKIAPSLLVEAMDAIGGNSYANQHHLSRFYKDAPANLMLEGSGNNLALDVARIVQRAPQLFDAVLDWVAEQLGRSGQGTIQVLHAAISLTARDEGAARLLTEQLALAVAAAQLREYGANSVADSFVETRLGGQWRASYGMLDTRHDARGILDLLYPPL